MDFMLNKNGKDIVYFGVILTPAGEYFYKKSLVLVADYERMCWETGKLAKYDKAVLVIGYLRCYSGQEFHLALEEFSSKYSDVSVKLNMATMKNCMNCFVYFREIRR